jgi:hypothetical protein
LKNHDHYTILELISGENVDEKFKDFIVNDVYSNKLRENPDGRNDMYIHGNLHSFNKHEFRSPDFIKNVDYLFSGCSVTFGTGLPLEKIWPEIVAKSLKTSYGNISRSGDSITGQVYKIFKYINEFGNPKNIVALFPDFNRFLMFNNQELMLSKNFYGKDLVNTKLKDLYLENISPAENQSRIAYFKRPLIAQEVITSEISNIYSSNSIHVLSEYCKSNNINFVWSTWDQSTENLINAVGNPYSNFISMETNNWKYDLDLNKDVYTEACHKEYEDNIFFHNGSDLEHGIEHAHFGSHRHMHFAEKFLNHINLWGKNEN